MKKSRVTMAVGLIAIAATLASTSPAAANAVARAPIPAGTSIFLAWSANHYQGDKQIIEGCGSHGIRNRGSYQWVARGQDGQMFDGDQYKTTLHSDKDANQGTGFGWDRIFIKC